MRKKFIVAFLALSVLAIAGCGKEQPADTHVTEKVSVSDEDELINEDNTDIEKTEDTLDFSEFQDRWFYFASGVGGWRTVLQIKEDGSFSGTFSDSDMGSTGEGYPGGTYYFSDFHGKFSTPVKVNEYTYSMKIEEIGYENEVGTEEIKDEILYCYSTAYGLDEAEEILIFLPGAPFRELPEEYQNWVRNDMVDPNSAELPFYGLYNVKAENGFSSYEISDQMKDLMDMTKQCSDTLKASLEHDNLNQAEMNEKSLELYNTWDAALNTLWNKLKEELPEDKMNDLLKEQRAWIAEKEKAVEEAGEEAKGGSLEPLLRNDKAAELTEKRVYELYQIWEDSAE